MQQSSTNSLLAHLTLRFAPHPENIATESLAYVLRGSAVASRTLNSVLAQFCPETGSRELFFSTQESTDDGGRPDLVGRNSNGMVGLFLEAKFWAGLMERQPVGYLKQMSAPGVLLFVAPEKRLGLLWLELKQRLSTAGVTAKDEPATLLRILRADGKVVALISWRVLLGTIRSALEDAGEMSTAADVRQLEALCDRMDNDAFLPLGAEELDPTNGRRVIQFGDLASAITDQLVSTGEADVKGLRATGGNGWYGRYLQIGGFGCFLHFSAHAWIEWGHSPVWLTVKAPGWTVDKQIEARCILAGISCAADEEGTHVPIILRAGADWETLIADGIVQIRAVIAAVQFEGHRATLEPSVV